MSNRIFLLLAVVALLFSACGPAATPEVMEVEVTREVEVVEEVEVVVTPTAEPQTDPGEVVIVGFGGTTQGAQDTAFFTPFEEATGVRVIQDVDPSIDRLRAMVEGGAVTVDIAQGDKVSYDLGVEYGLWEPIDYSYFRPEDLEAIPDDQLREYGFGNLYYSQIIAYDLRQLPEEGPFPENWADFWDLEKFPGMRALPSCQNPWEALPEAAVMSAGVPMDEVYPIDIDLALEQVKKIAPNTIFWDSPAVAAQLLNDQQVVMTQAPNGRIKVLIDAGVPLAIEWNQARIQSDYWFVLKDAPNKENAMKFLAFAALPQQQAIFSQLTAYPNINPKLYDYIDEEEAKLFPNYPANLEKQFVAGNEWWAEYRDEWAERCTEALLELE